MTTMTKNEFLSKLESELKKNGIEDVDDIMGEYEEHFAFKLADGFTEEEIAAKLGKPAELAAQFENEKPGEKRGGRKLATVIGLVFTDFFAYVCFAMLWAFEAAMAAATAAIGTLSVCLLLGLNIHSWIPAMPYWCGAIFGLCFAALTILAAVGCIYVAAYLRQLMRSFARFNHNSMAAASGRPVLPPVPDEPPAAGKNAPHAPAVRACIAGRLSPSVLCSACSYPCFPRMRFPSGMPGAGSATRA
jgi:hypothetical protein